MSPINNARITFCTKAPTEIKFPRTTSARQTQVLFHLGLVLRNVANKPYTVEFPL
jgi:hypothetical protein